MHAVRWFEFSLFSGRGTSRALKPYLRIGGFELCISRQDVAVYLPSIAFGYLRGAGPWFAKVAK